MRQPMTAMRVMAACAALWAMPSATVRAADNVAAATAPPGASARYEGFGVSFVPPAGWVHLPMSPIDVIGRWEECDAAGHAVALLRVEWRKAFTTNQDIELRQLTQEMTLDHLRTVKVHAGIGILATGRTEHLASVQVWEIMHDGIIYRATLGRVKADESKADEATMKALSQGWEFAPAGDAADRVELAAPQDIGDGLVMALPADAREIVDSSPTRERTGRCFAVTDRPLHIAFLVTIAAAPGTVTAESFARLVRGCSADAATAPATPVAQGYLSGWLPASGSRVVRWQALGEVPLGPDRKARIVLGMPQSDAAARARYGKVAEAMLRSVRLATRK